MYYIIYEHLDRNNDIYYYFSFTSNTTFSLNELNTFSHCRTMPPAAYDDFMIHALYL
eukprot:UN02908